MKATTARIHEIDSLIDRQAWEEAMQKINHLPLEQPVDRRIQKHLLAKAKIRQGKFLDAIEVLKEALTVHGPHIGVHADLATAHYHQGQSIEFKNQLRTLENEFEKIKAQLSPESIQRTALVIGRFHELIGDVSQALDLYEKAISSYTTQTDPERYFAFLAQMLRLRSTFRIQVGTPELFSELTFLKQNYPTIYTNIEVQQALLYAECAWVGVETGFIRLERLLSQQTLSPHDSALFAFDFVEELIIQKLWDSTWENRMTPLLAAIEPSEMDVYRALILRVIKTKKLSYKEILEVEPLMTPAEFLQLLTIGSVFESDPIEIVKKRDLHLSALPARSRLFWKKRWLHCTSDEGLPTVVHLSLEDRMLTVGIQSASLQKQELLFNFINEMIRKPEWPIAELSQSLWKGSLYNESYYHRIRYAAQRLNKILFGLTGVEKTIYVNTEKVCFTKIQMTVGSVGPANNAGLEL